MYLEKEGKLFFWWDSSYPLTEKTLATYKKYDLLQDDDGLIQTPDFITDDALKGAYYFFCTNDLSSYKKVITNTGFGYFDPPKLNCEIN